jgi:hypothetical protein
MAFGNLTVDFRQLARVPVRDRAALAQSAQASEIFGNLTPSQIASLFPDYYKKFIPQASGGGGMAAGLTGAGTTTGTGTGTATTTGTTSPTAPTRPGFIQDIVSDITQPGGQQQSGSNISKGQKRLMELIASGEGGYNSSNGGTKNGNILYSTHSAVRDGKKLQDMTIGEIEKYMSLPLGHPDRLFAVGKYQLTKTGAFPVAVTGLGLKSTDVFTPELQEKMGLYATMQKRPAVGRYIRGESDDLLAAQKELALEYASIPVPVDMEVPGHGYRRAGSSAYGAGNKSSHSIESVKESLIQARQDTLAQQQTGPTATLPGTAPITGQAPQGSDAQIQNLLGTPADQSTAVVAAPRGPAKTMILSLGTNDFSDPKNTYQNTLDAINEGRRKGYNVVVVPPTGSNDRFKAAYDEVMRAVSETGAPVEQPQSYSSDGYHPTADEYKRIGEKYQGAVVVGDSIAVGIGQHVDNGKTVATEGIRTDTILSRLRSEEIAKLETTQVTTSSNFDPAVFAQIDPRVKEWYDKANDSEKRLLEAAITQKGLESINQTMQKYPKATATAAGATILEEMGEINNVEYGTLGNRNNPVDTALQRKISAMVSDIYGPEYKAVIYSGGEPTSGQKVSDSGRHDVKFDAEGKMIGGQAADLYITHRETGEVVPRAQQIKAAQYWQARQFGGVGLGMEGGGIHLDQIQRGEATGENLSYRAWAYGEGDASQRFLTKEERSAMIQARSEDFDISSITIPKQQTAQTLPGTETQTQSVRPDDTAVIPLQQSTANTAPAMKLGGEMNFKEPNTVKESMSLMSNGKEVAQFNKNEQVNVEDGKIKVQNEYDKRTKEAQQRNDKGTPANQYSMRQTTTPETPRTFPDQVKYGIVPQSPSAKRQFETAQFGGYDHFSRRSHSS